MSWRLLRDTDSMSMAHSLEVRVPLIDDRILDYVLNLSPGWDKRYGYPKRLLTESTKDLIPPFITGRPKQGFQLPMEIWLKKGLRHHLNEAFLSEDSEISKVYSRAWLKHLLEGFLENRYSYDSVWKLVVLDLWAKKNKVELIPSL